MNVRKRDAVSYAKTGIEGLDQVLHGGFTSGSIHLVEGESGAGKTTLALQFCLEGARRRESVLYVTLAETRREIEIIIRSHGWTAPRLRIVEPVATETKPTTLFHPSEVELGETMKRLKAEVARVRPRRLVIDSLSEIRLLAQSSLRYRRELLELKQFLIRYRCTVLLIEETASNSTPRSLLDGVLLLEQLAPAYGIERRRLRILKMRARDYACGFHDYVIRRGGLQVFPRLVAARHRTGRKLRLMPAGVAALDDLLGGGVAAGTSSLLLGPAGTGKSSLAMQFALSAVRRGSNATFFMFDERPEVLRQRSAGLGMRLDPHLKSGRLHLHPVDPAELSPGQFADLIRREVVTRNVEVVVIDSLNGYLHAMTEEHYPILQMHELLSYLGQQGVMTLLVMAQIGIVGQLESPIDTSYLTDNVILLRYFEAEGLVRQAISVVKQRSGSHERSIREFQLTSRGIVIGRPLRQFQGVLAGTPTYTGAPSQLLEANHAEAQTS